MAVDRIELMNNATLEKISKAQNVSAELVIVKTGGGYVSLDAFQ